jgi:tripartite-type tricarboxylate transporter receptor subunit TctC
MEAEREVIRLIARRRVLSGAAALSATAAFPHFGQAANWRPTRTVRLIVPDAPGSTRDVMGRLLAAHLQTAWGRSAIVKNRGTMGTVEVERSYPDGHTILVGHPTHNEILYSIIDNIEHMKGLALLTPVSNLIRIPNIISAHPSVPIKSIADMIAYINANPDKLAYGSSGVGQSPHLAMAWLLQLTGLKMVHVPFRGAGPALQATLAGDIQILSDDLYPALPKVLDGKLNALAVTAPERSALAPNIPAVRETRPQLAKFGVSSGFGVSLPMQAPAPIVDALNKEIKVFLEREDIKDKVAKMGARTDYGTPQQFSDFVETERVKFAAIIEQGGLHMDVIEALRFTSRRKYSEREK